LHDGGRIDEREDKQGEKTKNKRKTIREANNDPKGILPSGSGKNNPSSVGAGKRELEEEKAWEEVEWTTKKKKLAARC